MTTLQTVLTTTTTTATTSATLAAGKHTPVDATSAALTMTLPTPARAGARLRVEKIDTTANTVTVSGTIRGAATTITLTSQFHTIELVAESVSSWRPVSDHRTITGIANDPAVKTAIDARGTVNGWGSGGSGGVNLNDVGYDIIVLAGQSNMVGINSGGTADTARLDVTDPRVWAYNPYVPYQGISLAIDPLVQSGTGYGVGPGMPFARWYAGLIPQNRKVLLIPVAAGGTALGGTVVPRWHPNLTGSLYDTMVSVTQAALTAAGPNSRVAAVLWGQGENDGDAGRTQAQYSADLLALVDATRTTFGNVNLPFCIIGMTPEGIASSTGRAAVDAAQQALPSQRPYTSYTAGVAGYSDGTHYTVPGQRLNGANLARGYGAAKSNTAGTASAYPYTYLRTPGQPTALAATAGSGQVALTWTAPATGGAPTDYVVQYQPSGGSWTTFTHAASTATSITVTGLTNGTAYSFTVAGTNAIGPGVASSAVSATPAATGQSLTNTTAPTITGTPTQGQTLTATNGSWSATPDSYTYQWNRAGVAISGATASTYVLAAGDVGNTITVTVTAIKAGYTSGTATSAATAAVASSGGGGTTTTEAWTGTDGAAWPAAWSTRLSPTIVGNKGRMPVNAAACRTGMTGTTGDFDETVTFSWAFASPPASGNSTVEIGVGAVAPASTNPVDGYTYGLILTGAGVVGGMNITRFSAGAQSVLTQSFPTINPGVGGYKARVQRVGATINGKVWAADASEPASWTLTTTDASPLTGITQKVWLSLGGPAGVTVDFDDLTANWA